MTQTIWHAPGATDAPPHVSGGNTEASATNETAQSQKAATDPDALAAETTGSLSPLQASPSENVIPPEDLASYRETAQETKKNTGLFIPEHGVAQRQEGQEDLSESPSKRIELRASREFVDTLDSLTQVTQFSRADVIRRAIALYARALLEKSRGHVIGIAALEDNQIKLKEIIQI